MVDLKCLSSLTVHSNNKQFRNLTVTCDKKWILYNNQQWPAQSLDCEEAPKHFQSQTCIKTRSWSLFGGMLPAWSTTVLRIPVKPIHLRSMHAQQINEMHWKHWSTERTQFFSTTKPDSLLHNQCFKSWTNWAIKFCFTIHIYLTSC